MKVLKNKTFQSISFLYVFLVLIEIIFRIITKTSVFSLSLIRVFIANGILAIIFGYIASLFKNKYTYWINSGVVLLFGLYAWLQLGFNNYIGVYMSINASSQLGAVKDYIGEFFKAMKHTYYLMYLPFVFCILGIVLMKFYRKKHPEKFFTMKFKNHNKTINTLATAISLIILVSCFYISLDDNFDSKSFQAISNKKLFITASNPSLCIKEFGISSFSIVDFKTKFYEVEEDNELYYAMANEESKTREFDDTKWKNLIANESDETLNSLNNFFINNAITEKNDKTGLFKDKNLIIIMMESVNDIFYNEEYFPNFSKLVNEGWYFTNNYSPRNSCATGNNEFSAMTSLYSIYNECTANVYKENTYYESIFGIFNDADYVTNSLHNFSEWYYYRSEIHSNMGSQRYYGADDLGIDYYTYYGGWASDEDLMDRYLTLLDNRNKKKPFMSFLTTVTSHQPYTNTPYGNLYYDMTENTGYSDYIRHYMSKLKVLDNSLGILLDGLEERGILDDTVIVLFGDHYPYGIKTNYLSEVLDRSLEDYEVEKVPLVIYNSELESKTYDYYTSYMNLLPTIANLFDLEYDPRLYVGTDIFDASYNNTVVFADSSWKNDIAYYDAATGKINYFTEKTYTDEEIMNMNRLIYSKMNASSLAVKNNYFAYLNENLNSDLEVEETGEGKEIE